jgi:putative hydrolase of the HAD superfamily
MIRAVFFDLDGTLWDRDKAFRQLVEAQHQTFSQLAAVHRLAYVNRMVELDDHGLGDKRAVYARVVSELGLEPDLATLLYDNFLTEYGSFFEPFPEVLATLRWLRDRKVKLGIITNGTIAMQEPKIEGLGLTPLMDAVLISERERVRKPDRAIFERGLSRLGVDSAASWFVGDHPDTDIRGASEAGLTAVWRRSWGQANHATHSIASLDELIPLLIATGQSTPQ